LRNHIYQQHQDGICASALSRTQPVGQATVGRIYQQFTIRKAKERISLNCPLYLGIDEHTLHKKQRFCTTFCDLKNHKVYEVHPGRSEAELADFLATLKGRERVRLVCIDLSSPYRSLVRKWFPRAKIVADRFHAVRLVYQHCVQMMRAIAPEIRNQRGALCALRKAPEKLTPKQMSRRDHLFNRHPQIKVIYERMHSLRKLMKHKRQNKQQCRAHAKALLQHIHWLRHTGLRPLQTLAKSLKQWIEPIARMWRFSKNNAITEGFHRKMKLIQRRAYGFRNFNNYRLRGIAQCG
jgi:transposase